MNYGVNVVYANQAATPILTPSELQQDPELVRGGPLPIPLDYTPALHAIPQANGLDDPTNAPSTTGIGGYSQSPIPTTFSAQDLADTGLPSQNPAGTAPFSPQAAPTAAAPQSGNPPAAAGSGSNPTTGSTSAAPTGASGSQAAPAETTDASAGTRITLLGTFDEAGLTIYVVALGIEPDPNKEGAEIDDRAQGEPSQNGGVMKLQIATPDGEAKSTSNLLIGPARDAAEEAEQKAIAEAQQMAAQAEAEAELRAMYVLSHQSKRSQWPESRPPNVTWLAERLAADQQFPLMGAAALSG